MFSAREFNLNNHNQKDKDFSFETIEYIDMFSCSPDVKSFNSTRFFSNSLSPMIIAKLAPILFASRS